MTLNEKLSFIADLENENLSEDMIERIVESVENPEPIGKRYATVQELMGDLEDEDET